MNKLARKLLPILALALGLMAGARNSALAADAVKTLRAG